MDDPNGRLVMDHEVWNERILIREARIVYVGDALEAPADIVNNPKAAATLVGPMVDDEPCEKFGCIDLDGRHRPIGIRIVSKGSINTTIVHPREVFRGAILQGAVALILFHNHPSGQLNPSHEDLVLTERIRKAGHVIGIPILDHVIVTAGGNRFLSMKETSPWKEIA